MNTRTLKHLITEVNKHSEKLAEQIDTRDMTEDAACEPKQYEIDLDGYIVTVDVVFMFATDDVPIGDSYMPYTADAIEELYLIINNDRDPFRLRLI